MDQLRVSLIAPSGAGKSTVAGLLKSAFEQSGRTVQILKLAEPLYQLQTGFYRECGIELVAGQQDQHLLEVIATEMRRIAPLSLVNHFGARLASTTADVVINDDLRDDKTDWPWLRRNNFTVIRVVAGANLRKERLSGRGDLTLVQNSPLNAQIANIREDHKVTNEGSLDDLRAQVEAQVVSLLLHSTVTTKRN